MRLNCPNCDAQYEVPDSVIPKEGRDVQCSNCGTTWYQYHPDFPPEGDPQEPEIAKPEAAAPETGGPEPAPTEPPEAEPPLPDTDQPEKAEPEAAGAEGDDAEADDAPRADDPEPADEAATDVPAEEPAAQEADDDTDEDAEEVVEAQPAAQRRELDPAVADILRQEAEREQAAREAETQETFGGQPELGLPEGEDEASRRAREARERMAKMRGEDLDSEIEAGEDIGEGAGSDDDLSAKISAAEAAATAAALNSRKELLPDIEEINSTLRSTGDRDVAGDDLSPEAPARERKKRGFRRGFLLAILIFVIALLLYIYAPDIARAVPALDGLMTGYVNWVDGLRLWLDGQLRSLLAWLDNTAAQSGG